MRARVWRLMEGERTKRDGWKGARIVSGRRLMKKKLPQSARMTSAKTLNISGYVA